MSEVNIKKIKDDFEKYGTENLAFSVWGDVKDQRKAYEQNLCIVFYSNNKKFIYNARDLYHVLERIWYDAVDRGA